MGRGAWRAAVHGVAKSQARPSMHTHGNEGGWQALPMGWAARREAWVRQTCHEDSFSACDAAPKCGVMMAFVKEEVLLM